VSGTNCRHLTVCTDAVLCVLLAAAFFMLPNKVQAVPLSCPAEHQLNVAYDNGAGFDLCWESKQRESIVLSDIHYRSVSKQSISIISTLRLAQLHVAYDDNNITYNDVTQFGLGGGYLSTLTDADCTDGELIDINGRAGMCSRLSPVMEAYYTAKESRIAQVFSLHSISHVGAYSYLLTWKFFDDGSIAASVGAAGSLQRGSADSPLHGRALEGAAEKFWLSHTHNYYWRIDFDLGDSALDDVVSEVSYEADAEGRRARHVERVTSEAARKIDPDNMLSWFISDNAGEVIPGDIASYDITQSAGYVIEPLAYGHKLVRSDIEPYTDFDFFVTKQNDCERFISENAKYNPGCGDDILDFINDESLVDQDLVVWHRISFHHVPRNEDRRHMHSHWDGFVMQARNLSTLTPGHSGVVENSAPVLNVPDFLRHDAGEQVDIKLVSNDTDGDALIYAATGLPDGVQLTEDGVLKGTVTGNGNYRVALRVTDTELTSSALIQWQVIDTGGNGVVSIQALLYLLLLTVFCNWLRKNQLFI